MEKLNNMAVIDFSEYIKDLEICKKDLGQIKDLIKSFNENHSSYGGLYIEFKVKESKASDEIKSENNELIFKGIKENLEKTIPPDLLKC